MSLSGRLEQAVIDTENYTEIFNKFVNGDDQTEVITSGGPVSSIAKAIKDLEDYYVNNNIVTSAESARDEAEVQAMLSSGFADEASSDAAESLMYRNQASGFSISASNAQSAAESARDLAELYAISASGSANESSSSASESLTYRNQASGFSASALEFSIEASGYAEQSQIDYSNAVKNDGTILQSGKIPVVTGSGILGESEFGFGANLGELLSFNDNKFITARDAFFINGGSYKRSWVPSDFQRVTVASGQSNLSQNSYVTLIVSNTGDIGAVRPQAVATPNGFAGGVNYGVFPRDRVFCLSTTFGLPISQYTDGLEFRIGVFRNNSGGPCTQSGDMGIMFKGSDARMYGVYLNGSEEEVVDLGYNLSNSSNQTYEVAIYGMHSSTPDKSGLIIYVNGVLAGILSIPGAYYSSSVTWYTIASLYAQSLDNSPKNLYIFGMGWQQASTEFNLPQL